MSGRIQISFKIYPNFLDGPMNKIWMDPSQL